ncbi:MAG: hypothetical protein WC781_05645 [Candidatus Pacearchaeota archaeon]|jgi:hypothetical protein
MEIELPPELKEFIKNSNWIFAKTYADFAPHEYVVRNNFNFNIFQKLVIFIRERGVCRKWGNRIGMYLDYNGHSYWTMGNPINQTTIINRKISIPEDREMELPKGTQCHSDLNPPTSYYQKEEIKDISQRRLF